MDQLFFLPVIVFFIILFTSILLFIGVLLSELKIEYGRLFKVALLAEFVFVISVLTRLVMLIFFKEISTFEDLQFQPFSILEILNTEIIDKLFIYPLGLINLFELGYLLVLAWLMRSVLNSANEMHQITYIKSLKVVALSYGSGLLLWVIIVIFTTLNMS